VTVAPDPASSSQVIVTSTGTAGRVSRTVRGSVRILDGISTGVGLALRQSLSWTNGGLSVHGTTQIDGDYVWTPDSNNTVRCGPEGFVSTDIHTGRRSVPIPIKQNVWLADMTADGGWFIFEIRDYLGRQYTIDFLSSKGGEIHKMPNYPGNAGECHPGFSPDGKWLLERRRRPGDPQVRPVFAGGNRRQDHHPAQ
jgi:hypothetical protein